MRASSTRVIVIERCALRPRSHGARAAAPRRLRAARARAARVRAGRAALAVVLNVARRCRSPPDGALSIATAAMHAAAVHPRRGAPPKHRAPPAPRPARLAVGSRVAAAAASGARRVGDYAPRSGARLPAGAGALARART